MRCGQCGSKNLKVQNVTGRSFRWKDYSSVVVTRPLALTVCQECQNMIFKAGEAQSIDNAIKASITEQIRIAVSNIREQNDCEQKDIANRLGSTPEYLSEVKNGRAVPSFQFFNFLKTLAMDKEAFKTADPRIHIDFKVALSAKTI